MCGITGFFLSKDNSNLYGDKLASNLEEMTLTLWRRGPDHNDTWINDSHTLGLGHTRLSIRDLSVKGNQPMQSSCGRYVMVYNGEIYSHEDLKKKLIEKNALLKSTSDTEILLEYISQNGLADTLKKLNGMFAFAIYDKKKDKLYLIRDQIGIKPLYWGKIGNNFFFGSELKSIKKFLGFENLINKTALNYFLKWGFITSPLSIYKDIYKVMPGEIIEVDSSINIKKKKYWELDNKIANKNLQIENLNFKEATLYLEKLINQSVKKRLVSDVSVGCFLSGGIDSSLIAYFMQQNSQKKINTFTVGFEEKDFNESQSAKNISRFIGTNHHEIFFSDKDIVDYFDRIIDIYDEPFADPSQLPTLLVCEYAKKYATVVLSGDGGDELFGGYDRYIETNKIYTNLGQFKLHLLKLINTFPENVQNLIGKIFDKNYFFEKNNSYIQRYYNKSLEKIYSEHLAQFPDYKQAINPDFFKDIYNNKNLNSLIKNNYEKLMYNDTLNYLPECILSKVDRASMYNSLEVRVPFLDPEIIEFAWNLPIKFKIYKNKQKIILKEILNKKFPSNLIQKKKIGFGIPIDNWLRTKLFNRSKYYLSEQKLKKYKIFNSTYVNHLWNKHITQNENNGRKLWNIIMMQKWMEENS